MTPTTRSLLALALAALVDAPQAQSPDELIARLRDDASRQAAMSQLYARRAEVGAALADALENCDTSETATLAVIARAIALVGGDAVDALDPVLDHLPSAKGDAVPALTEAWVVLAPYAPTPQNRKVHELLFQPVMEDEIRFRLHTQRYARESVRTVRDVDDLIRKLAENKIFAREVLAERLARFGPAAATAEPALINALRDRSSRPDGWDQVRQNGLIVPLQDGFRWRAGMALIAIAPRSEGVALAHGAIAAGHPDIATRKQALRELAGMGPAAKDAMPDLLEIFRRGEDALLGDGLQVLGMMGPAAGEAYSTVVALTKHTDPRIKRRAESVRRQLQAMQPEVVARHEAAMARATERENVLRAITDALLPSVEKEAARKLALGSGQLAAIALVRQLDSTNADVAARARELLEELPAGSFDAAAPELLSWYVDNRKDKTAHELLRAIGHRLPEPTRALLRSVVAEQHSSSWTSNNFSTHTGGGSITRIQRLTHQILELGHDSELKDILEATTAENPFRREAALRILQDGLREGTSTANAAVVEACRAALQGDHKGPAEFEDESVFNGNKKKQEFDRTTEVRGLARQLLERLAKDASQDVRTQAQAALDGN